MFRHFVDSQIGLTKSPMFTHFVASQIGVTYVEDFLYSIDNKRVNPTPCKNGFLFHEKRMTQYVQIDLNRVVTYEAKQIKAPK